jgi:hypothetical protein
MLRHIGLSDVNVFEQLPNVFLTLTQLADDAQTDRRGQNSKQPCCLVEYLINLTAHAPLAIKFIYSDVRIYTINEVSEPEITKLQPLDQDKP